MAVKNWKEAEERIRAAMIPQSPTGGNFAPGLQKLRQSASKRRLLSPGRPIPAS